jgi:hypothetical protein
VENRHEAVNHPRKAIVKLKSKKVRTAIERLFYQNEIAVRKNLTGQLCFQLNPQPAGL